MNEEIIEIHTDAPPYLLGKLQETPETEHEFPDEPDLLSYILLLGLHLEAGERVRAELEAAGDEPDEVYQTIYGELARAQADYSSAHYAMAEAARDDRTGRMVNGALRREVAALKGYLLPRLESERDQLLQRREALMLALRGDAC